MVIQLILQIIYFFHYRLEQNENKPQPTILDGLVMWYLGLISSVSKAAMPIAPTLRDTLLTQSKLVRKISITVQWNPL